MNHRNAWDQIPWLVNGSASDKERTALEQHLDECAECRAEVNAQRALLQGMQTRPLVEKMPHASFQKLNARIDADRAAVQHRAQRPRRSPRMVQWLSAAVVIQALLVGTLLVVLLRSPAADDGPYRTVSSPSAVAGRATVRAVFAMDMTLGELQALLERSHLRIIDGPSADGVYTLATTTGFDDRQALLTLRAHPAVRFAEPIAH
ncbi:MAG: zf-HC2 domain-containing protein [Steroidobacteraceae bacterium]